MPSGIPHIIGNEAAERFSFYGMKAVLAVFMVQYLHLMNDTPGTAMTATAAAEKVHLWSALVYITPFIGAFIADFFFGKYRVIIGLSIIYCLGHAALAFMGLQGDASIWLMLGLGLIALGSGGIKPCVSAHVGDQFGASNSHLLPKIFNWFYFSINLGAMVSSLMTPWLMKWYGPHLAFGIPGVLMALATLIFWMGRKSFVHVPAKSQQLLTELKKPETKVSLLRLAPLYLFLAMFWALFDQTASTWVFQAQDMDLQFMGIDWLPSQVQSLNSVFVLTFIPLFAYLLYPALSKVYQLTPLRKIGIGLFIMCSSFTMIAIIQNAIDSGQQPNIGWQVLAYALLTASEVMVSIVALEFAYTQAPRTMKSLVMCFYLGAVALGNIFTSGINSYIQISSPTLTENISHDGYDATAGTDDDLTLTENKIQSPATETLTQGAQLIDEIFESSNQLPTEESGQSLIAAMTDPWGNPLSYTRLNKNTARISSNGPDQKPRTEWDLGVILTVPEAEKVATSSWTESFRPESPWLDRRKQELGIQDKVPDDNAITQSIESKFYAGGGTKLEGSSYFWFFTKVMFITALCFIPYAFFYREKTHLQE